MNTNNCKIINRETRETFYTHESAINEIGERSSERNRIIRASKSSDGYITGTKNFSTIKAIATEKNCITSEREMAREIELMSDWRNHPATDAQIIYMISLGINTSGRSFTKGQASSLIDAAKNGSASSYAGQDEGADSALQFIGEAY